MRILILILIHFFFLGCQAKKEIHPPLLEGYWEIEKVTSHGETFHPKGAAPLVDYYFLKNKTAGYRKKLAPSFAAYQTSEQQYEFQIQREDENHYLHFNLALVPWKEKIIRLDSSQLVLEHQDKVYHYTRHKKIVLDE